MTMRVPSRVKSDPKTAPSIELSSSHVTGFDIFRLPVVTGSIHTRIGTAVAARHHASTYLLIRERERDGAFCLLCRKPVADFGPLSWCLGFSAESPLTGSDDLILHDAGAHVE